MKKEKTKILLSAIASLCFFISYIVVKTNLNLILSFSWFLIFIGYKIEYKSKVKK